MDHAGDGLPPEDRSRRKRGEPGSDDQFARGGAQSGASDVGAELVDDFEGGAGLTADDAASAGEAAVADPTAELRAQLEEQRDKHLRLAAEFDNYRKRMVRERNEAGVRAQADLVKQMLEVIDDIGRFSQFDPATTDSVALAEAVDMIERKLNKTLGTAGLVTVNPVNEPFDPAVHEAISTEPALSPEDDNLVSQVYQLGYLFNGQLLRPARVVVKQYNG